jgi:polysaccharide pyruvyl transferase WcaK-like protein
MRLGGLRHEDRRVKILFVNDSTSSSNWGDRAAAVALAAMAKECGGEIVYRVTEQNLWDACFSEGSPCSIEEAASVRRSRELARTYLPPAVLEARRRLLAWRDGVGQDQHALIPASWDAYEAFAERVLREKGYGWPVLLGAMDDADVMLVHGASLHGEIYLVRAILFLIYLMKARFGKPVVLANHTSGVEGSLRHVADHVYPLVDDVVYRDPISAERWASVYGGRFAGDSAFLFEPAEREAWSRIAGRPTYFDVWPDTAPFDPAEPYICLGGSAIFHDRKDWGSLLEGYTAVITELQHVYSGTILLTASAELDEPVLRTLASRFDLPLVGVRTPIQQAADVVGNADAYVGGRWHPAILAVRGGSPLVLLRSQTVKMTALAQMTGAAEPFDTLDLQRDAHAIAARTSRVVEQGDGLRARLKEIGRTLARSSWGNVAYLDRISSDREPAAAAAGGTVAPTSSCAR